MVLVAALAGVVVTLAVAPLVAAAGRRWGFIDTPNQRSMHTRPTPRSGGIACMVGMAAAFGVGAALGRPVPWALLAVALALGIVGVVDDRLHLAALQRLLVQALAGAVVGLLLGGSWWIVLGLVVLPVAVNMLNFMDGINGITCLTMLVWAIVMLVAGLRFDGAEVAIIGAAAGASAVGFLPWNAPRARAFLGDGGSYAFGALVGIGSMTGVHASIPIGILFGPMILYLADTGSTIVARALRREPILEAHRSHAYQRLVAETGWAHAVVSALVGLGSAVISASWFVPGVWCGIVVSVIVTAAYLASPTLAKRKRRVAEEQT